MSRTVIGPQGVVTYSDGTGIELAPGFNAGGPIAKAMFTGANGSTTITKGNCVVYNVGKDRIIHIPGKAVWNTDETLNVMTGDVFISTIRQGGTAAVNHHSSDETYSIVADYNSENGASIPWYECVVMIPQEIVYSVLIFDGNA